MWSELENEERLKTSANAELTQLQAMKVLAGNNDLGAEIHIAGLKSGISVNTRLLPIIEAEIEEIENFLKGHPNNWE